MDDPGARRLFVDLHRRRAEQTHSTDIELWAYEQYEGTRP
ncbi:6PGD fold domain-containing protein [Corynebacterium aquatimens]